MDKVTPVPVEFDMIDVSDELFIINAMVTTALNLTKIEMAENELLQQNIFLLISNRLFALNQSVDKHNGSQNN